MKYFTRGLFASLAAAAVEKGKRRTFGENIKFFFLSDFIKIFNTFKLALNGMLLMKQVPGQTVFLRLRLFNENLVLIFSEKISQNSYV